MKRAITFPSPGARPWKNESVSSFVSRLLSQLQAVKQQGGQNLGKFFPTLTNHLAAEQLEHEQSQEHAGDSTSRESHINAGCLSCSTVPARSVRRR